VRFAEHSTELRNNVSERYRWNRRGLVGRAGFEPATNGLKGHRELSQNQWLSPKIVPQTSEFDASGAKAWRGLEKICGTLLPT
jgi:hypothetical protein